MATRIGDMQTLGWWITEPDFPAESDVRDGTDYDNGALTGTLVVGGGGGVDVTIEVTEGVIE